MYKKVFFSNYYYMSKFRIVNLLDKVFISVSIFLIIYAWINFHIRDLWTTFVLSLIFSFACVFLLFYLLNKRQIKRNISKKKVDAMNEKFLAFKLLNKTDKIKLLNTILKNEFETIIKGNKIYLTKENKTHCYIIATHLTKITQDDLLNLLDEHNFNTDYLHIICNDYSANLHTKIFKDKEIYLINKEKLYFDFFEKFNTFPSSENINTKVIKLKFSDILKQFFLPHKAKSYFICGLILIFSSIILPYHAYYVVFGSMLLLFAVLCKILPKFKD